VSRHAAVGNSGQGTCERLLMPNPVSMKSGDGFRITKSSHGFHDLDFTIWCIPRQRR
jgi:hypothetical protein